MILCWMYWNKMESILCISFTHKAFKTIFLYQLNDCFDILVWEWNIFRMCPKINWASFWKRQVMNEAKTTTLPSFLGTRPKGEQIKLSNGGCLKGPLMLPFRMSLLTSGTTTSWFLIRLFFYNWINLKAKWDPLN